jgi:hypothetical protein
MNNHVSNKKTKETTNLNIYSGHTKAADDKLPKNLLFSCSFNLLGSSKEAGSKREQ